MLKRVIGPSLRLMKRRDRRRDVMDGRCQMTRTNGGDRLTMANQRGTRYVFIDFGDGTCRRAA